MILSTTTLVVGESQNIIRRLKLILSTTTLIVGGSQNANGQIPIVLHTSRTTLFTKSLKFLPPPPLFFFKISSSLLLFGFKIFFLILYR